MNLYFTDPGSGPSKSLQLWSWGLPDVFNNSWTQTSDLFIERQAADPALQGPRGTLSCPGAIFSLAGVVAQGRRVAKAAVSGAGPFDLRPPWQLFSRAGPGRAGPLPSGSGIACAGREREREMREGCEGCAFRRRISRI